MAPRGVSTWRRPYTSIYNNNYRYGTGLYSDTLTDIEKRYEQSISKTQLRSDRPDLSYSAYLGSNFATSSAPAGDSSVRETTTTTYTRPVFSPSPTPEITRSPTFENRLTATLKSAASALDEDVEEVVRQRIEKRKKEILARSASTSEVKTKSTTETTEESSRPVIKSLYDDATFWTLPKSRDKLADVDLDIPKSKRKAGGRQTPTNGPSSLKWKDRSSDLQDKVDSLEKSMSNSSTKLMSELSSLKARYHTELTDLNSSVDTTSHQATELQKLCKRQAKQIDELQSAYDGAQRNIKEALDEMNGWQTKCKSLKKEMDRLREELEHAMIRKSKA